MPDASFADPMPVAPVACEMMLFAGDAALEVLRNRRPPRCRRTGCLRPYALSLANMKWIEQAALARFSRKMFLWAYQATMSRESMISFSSDQVVVAVPEAETVATHAEVKILRADGIAADDIVVARLLEVDAEQAVVDLQVLDGCSLLRARRGTNHRCPCESPEPVRCRPRRELLVFSTITGTLSRHR